MTDCLSTPAVPALRPILRQHLLHLPCGALLLRPLQRADLPRWRVFDHRRQHGRRYPMDIDAEARFLAAVQRSRLQHDNDRLLLGVFAGEQGALLDEIELRLHSAHARSVELWSSFEHTAELHRVLQTLCPFLFDGVGLHRVFLLLPAAPRPAIAAALQSSGFEQEGVLRDHHRDGAGWQDRQLHALVAPVWRRRSDASA